MLILSEDYYTNIDEFVSIISAVQYDKAYQYRKSGGYYYYNVPCSFDIETSSFYADDKKTVKQVIMYIWQFCFNGFTVIGRTWDEWLSLLDKLTDAFKLSEKNRLLIYIHNLSYEFQFMRKYFTWDEVFAVDDRTPIKALTGGIEFRDSYILSGYSLAKTAENLHTYHIKKLVGDLNYDIVRTPETPLTHDEMMYCIHDVLVVVAYIQEQIDQYGKISKIPLTNTGRVRNFCRNYCFNGTSNNKEEKKKTKTEYKNLMHCLTLETDEYRLLKRCFMGGFTHANFKHVNDTLTDVTSYDFTSSYPYVMLSELYPMGKGTKRKINSLAEYKKLEKKFLMIFDLELVGVTPKIGYEAPISISKCWKMSGEVVNNGRLMYADSVLTSCTNIDLDVYMKFYNIEHCKIYNCYCYLKGYLPRNFLLAILQLYNDKTTLKGVEGKEVEYLHSKGMLNSCFGMTVTDIARDDIIYDSLDRWDKEPVNLDDAIESYNHNKSRFLFYPWGVFVTAYARRNLFSGIANCGNDYCYADTDSVKILNADKHKQYFDDYNKVVEIKLKRCAEVNNIDYNLFKPKTIKGVEKLIGVWDFDGHYKMFRALRAKCYMYVTDDDKLHATVAGVSKKGICDYMIDKYKTNDNIFNHFKNGLIIPPEYTGKLTHTYIDNEMDGVVNGYYYHELSGIHLSHTSFEISFADSFIKFLEGYRYRYEL